MAGLFGEKCNGTCGNCSNGDPCHHINGSCLHGCDPNYQGLFCTEGNKVRHVKKIIYHPNFTFKV